MNATSQILSKRNKSRDKFSKHFSVRKIHDWTHGVNSDLKLKIYILKIIRRGSLSLDNADLVISRCCFAEGKEMYGCTIVTSNGCTKNYNAWAQPLFCSVNLLFSDVAVAVAQTTTATVNENVTRSKDWSSRSTNHIARFSLSGAFGDRTPTVAQVTLGGVWPTTVPPPIRHLQKSNKENTSNYCNRAWMSSYKFQKHYDGK